MTSHTLLIANLNSPATHIRSRLISEFSQVHVLTPRLHSELAHCTQHIIPTFLKGIWVKLYSLLFILWFKSSYKNSRLHALGAFHGLLTFILPIDRNLVVTCMGSDVLTNKGKWHRYSVAFVLRSAKWVTVKSSNLFEEVQRLGATKEKIITLIWEIPFIPTIPSSPSTSHIIVSHRGCRAIYRNTDIVKAYALFKKNNPSTKSELWILEGLNADENELTRLRSLLVREELQVRFIPKCSQEEMQQIYHSAHVLVSYPLTDGYPQSILESAIHGRWHIVPSFPQYSDLQEVKNLLVVSQSIEALAQAFSKALALPTPPPLNVKKMSEDQKKLLSTIYSRDH